MSRCVATILSLLALVVLCGGSSISFRVEHRWGVSSFTDTGTLTAPLANDGTVAKAFKFSRRALSQQQLQSFVDCAYKNGLYTIRVSPLPTTTPGYDVISSVPAHCLLTSNFAERLSLDLTNENNLIGLNYRTNCQNQSVSVDVEYEGFGFSSDPIKVGFRYPRQAMSLSMDELLRRIDAGEEAGNDGRPGQPQKPQKSFLQQNWVFLLAGAVIMLQVIGHVADPNAGQAPAQVQGR